MTVTIHTKTQSKPVVRETVINTYTKDGMFCVYMGEVTEKYPMINVFRVTEKG